MHEVTGSLYVIEAEVVNDGVKFSDAFALLIRYCLVQTAPTTTHLYVTAQVHFKKTLNGLIKRSFFYYFLLAS